MVVRVRVPGQIDATFDKDLRRYRLQHRGRRPLLKHDVKKAKHIQVGGASFKNYARAQP